MSAQPLPFVRPGERFNGGSGRGAGGNKFRPVVRPKGAPAPRPAPTLRPAPPRQEARSPEEEPDGDDAQRKEGQPSHLPQQQQEEQPEERRDNATTRDGEPKERRRSGGDEDIGGEGERTDDGGGGNAPTSILSAVNRRGGDDEGSGSLSPLSPPPSQEEQVVTGALLPQPIQSVSSSSIQGVRQEEQQASPLVQEERERVHQHQPSLEPHSSTLSPPPSEPESLSAPLSRALSQQQQQLSPQRRSSPTLFFPLAPTAFTSSPLPSQAGSSLQPPPPPATTSPDQHARASDTNPSLDLLADICQQRSLLQEQSPTSSAAIRQPFGGPSFSRARAVKSRKRTGHAQQGGGPLKGGRGGAATGRGGKAAGKGRRKVLLESSEEEEEEELVVSDDLEEEGEAEEKEWEERAGMDDDERHQQRRHDHQRRLLETEYESSDDDELGHDDGVDSREVGSRGLDQIVRLGRTRTQRANGLDVLSAMASSDGRRASGRSFSRAHTNGASHRRRRQREVGDKIMDDEWMGDGGGSGAYGDEPDATAAAKDLPRRVRVSAKKDTGEWRGAAGVQRGTDGMYEDEGPDAAVEGKRGRRRTAGMGYAWREDADDLYVGDDADEEWRIGVDGSDGGGSSEDSDFGVSRKKKTKKKAAKKKSARQKRGGGGGGRRGGRGAGSRRASARRDGDSDEGEEHGTLNGDAESGASSSAAAAATRKPRKKRAPRRTAESVADEEVMDETLLNGVEEEKADGEEGANGDADAAAGEKRPRRRRAASKRTARQDKDSQDEGDEVVEENGTEGGERTRKTARRKRKRAGSAAGQQPPLDAATATLHARIKSYRNARLVQAAPGFKKLAVGGTQGGAQRSGRDGEERGPQQENQEEDGGLDASEARAGPQVELSATGEIIINQQSLQVAREEAQDEDAMEEVHEEAQQAATYTSFTTRTRTSRWTPEETKKFYMALRQCGTDFTTMELMFPTRDRAQLKNKFKKEERAHPELVYRYLDCQQPFDLQPFEASLGLLQVGQEKEQSQDGAADAGDVGGSGAGGGGIDVAGEGDGGAGASAAAAGVPTTSDNSGAAAHDDDSACADEGDGSVNGLPEGVTDSCGGTGEHSNRDAASSRDADHVDNGDRSAGIEDAPGRLVDAGGGEGGGVGAVDHEDDDGHEVVDDIMDDASDGVACAGLGDVVREDDDEYYDDVEGADADALTPGDVDEAWAE